MGERGAQRARVDIREGPAKRRIRAALPPNANCDLVERDPRRGDLCRLVSSKWTLEAGSAIDSCVRGLHASSAGLGSVGFRAVLWRFGPTPHDARRVLYEALGNGECVTVVVGSSSHDIPSPSSIE